MYNIVKTRKCSKGVSIVKIKVTFVVKKTQECITFQKDVNNKGRASFVYFDDGVGGEYVYAIGTNKMYKSKGNVICGDEIELDSLMVEYKFN